LFVPTMKSFSNTVEKAVAARLEGRVPAPVKHVEAGQPLFHEGDMANTVFQVIDGVVRTSKLLSNGKRQIISFCYPGDLVGISHDQSYHTECEAVSDVHLRVFRKNAGNIRFGDDPEIVELLLHFAAMEVANMQEHFLMLGCKTATEKVASFLLSLACRSGVPGQLGISVSLPMKRADIADYLGVTIETVSRTITKLKTTGVIFLPDPHNVCITDMEALKSAAEKN